jgi:DNA-binding transcriptional LysR family regulator
MDLRVLRYFLAVAREETISAAAGFLNITQPTLSRQLIDLETELGKTLFIRGNRRISLTEEGMLLRKRAQEIIELVDKTEAEFLASDEIVSGDIYIGAGETHALRSIAKVVRSLQREYPNIKYHLFSGNAEDVTHRLDTGLIDFGVLIEPADVNKYDSIRIPDVDVWGVLMRQDSVLAERDSITPEDLWGLPLICSRQEMSGKVVSSWLKKDYEELDIVATYNLLYNASLLVEEGMGYALCLDKIVNVSGNSALSFKPLKPRLEARLDIVWKKYQVFSKAARIFLTRLQETISAF